MFAAQIEESARQGVKLLVTPEYGLTGFPGPDRNQWWDYAVDIPDPARDNPCFEATKFPETVRRLSCMAWSYGVVLVAGLIDMKHCSLQHYPGCERSRDGWLLFNTALAFDADGAYIAKYHKANLWGEHAVDAGSECALPTFFSAELNMSFGIFVCADLVNVWPALELVNSGVQHFLMPLSWSNEMFQMQPLPWIQAWSKRMNVTIAAANARTRGSSTGSGIFSSGAPLAVIYNLSGAADELATASVSSPSPRDPPAVCPTRLPGSAAVRPHGSQWLTYQLDMSPGSHHVNVCSNYQPGFADGPTCCSVSYTSTAAGQGYVLVLLNGLDFAPGIESWAAEACSVLPCPDDGATDCLSYPTEALLNHKPSWFGKFSYVQLRATFSAPQMVFPQVLSGPERLLPPSEWHLENAGSKATSYSLSLSGKSAEELVTLQLYGRPYPKDPSSGQKCPCMPSSLWL